MTRSCWGFRVMKILMGYCKDSILGVRKVRAVRILGFGACGSGF